jgi:hypothetical protein
MVLDDQGERTAAVCLHATRSFMNGVTARCSNQDVGWRREFPVRNRDSSIRLHGPPIILCGPRSASPESLAMRLL